MINELNIVDELMIKIDEIENIVETELKKDNLYYQIGLYDTTKDIIVPIIVRYGIRPDPTMMRRELERAIRQKYTLFGNYEPFTLLCFNVLISVSFNTIYNPVILKIRERAKDSGLLQEIHETAMAIIYKPGSSLIKPEGKWSPDQKAINRELSELYKKNDKVVIPKNKRTKEWIIICCQLGEYRKDELLHLAWQMDIGINLDPTWDKAKIAKFMFKYMALFKI